MELLEVERDNKKGEERYQDKKDRFRISLDPANFQEQLMNEAGPHIEGMLKRVVRIKSLLENEGNGRDLRDPAICSDKLMTFLHEESISEGTDNMIDQLSIYQDILEKIRRRKIIDSSSSSSHQHDNDNYHNQEFQNQAHKTQEAESTTQPNNNGGADEVILSRAQND